MVNWAVLSELRARDHKVHIFVPWNDSVDPESPSPEIINVLRHHGVDVTYFHPQAGLDNMVDLVTNGLPAPPNVIFCYGVGSALQVHKINSIPKVCSLVDLDWQVPVYRRQYDNRDIPLSYADISQLHQYGQQIKEVQLEVLKNCQGVIEHANHHRVWLNENGVPDARYIPMPVQDPYWKGWTKNYGPPNKKIKIIMAGHLHGIATLSGLYYMAENVAKFLNPEIFDIQIFGADKFVGQLEDLYLPFPHVTFRGFVQDIQKEILTSDIFLVPTPIPLGFRTRIAEAWSLESCVIAHSANLQGMPEAVPDLNILASDNHRGLVDLIYEIGSDPEKLRDVAAQGRKAYEANYSGTESIVVDVIEDAFKNFKGPKFQEVNLGAQMSSRPVVLHPL